MLVLVSLVNSRRSRRGADLIVRVPIPKWTMHKGDSLDLISAWDTPLDLVVTDPPYAMGGAGQEHALSATVAIVLRSTAERLRRGSWFVVYCATSWRAIAYMVEAVRGIVEPVRIATWCKPKSRTKVSTPGWAYASVAVLAMRKGPKNRPELTPSPILDHLAAPVFTQGRRAQLPETVAAWSVAPFVIPGGVMLDPFAGSGALPKAAGVLGMIAHGLEKDPF